MCECMCDSLVLLGRVMLREILFFLINTLNQNQCSTCERNKGGGLCVTDLCVQETSPGAVFCGRDELTHDAAVVGAVPELYPQ